MSLNYINIPTQQIQTELDWFIEKLVQIDITSMLTLGVFAGGLELHLAKRFNQLGKPLAIVGIDSIVHPEIQAVSDEINSFETTTFTLLRTKTENLVQELLFQHNKITTLLGRYDLVFVDISSTYENAKLNFEFARKHAKLFVGIHDIVDSEFHRKRNCFVSKLWYEINKQEDDFICEERCDSNIWGGIGLVTLKSLNFRPPPNIF